MKTGLGKIFASVFIIVIFTLHNSCINNREKKDFHIAYTIDNREQQTLHNETNIIACPETALCIAKAIGYETYGNQILYYEYEIISEGDTVWSISGYPKEITQGGGIYVKIAKINGEIIELMHEK